MDWRAVFERALPYEQYLQAHGTAAHRERWQAVYDRVRLTDAQRELLRGFTRRMNVLVLAGTWCGDCVNQCPILQRVAEAAGVIDLRFFDRDADAHVTGQLKVNGGSRVPVAVFLSEDFFECSRYGDRTLAFYRKLAREQLGPSCPAGIAPPSDDVLAEATREWLAEVERVQLMLRLSPRLREKYGD
ncbi:MAG: thioredoxin family protein [Firmicutes bacterium]|nr:thioredoxin family protein [Bacillota bacterium]